MYIDGLTFFNYNFISKFGLRLLSLIKQLVQRFTADLGFFQDHLFIKILKNGIGQLYYK